jgi:hypothetical protein
MVFGAPIAFSVFPLNPASTFSLALFFLYHANGYTTAATRYGRQRAAHCAPHRLGAKGRGHCLHHPASSAVALLPGVGGGGDVDNTDWDAVGRMNPSGRVGTPEDIAGLALYLCSRAGAFTVGEVITCDGGSLLK